MDGIQRHWRVCPQACRQGEWGRRGGAPAQTGLPEVAGEEGALHQHQGGMCPPQACSQRPHMTPEPRKLPPYTEGQTCTGREPVHLSQPEQSLTRQHEARSPGGLCANLTLSARPTLHPQWCVCTG